MNSIEGDIRFLDKKQENITLNNTNKKKHGCCIKTKENNPQK